MTCKQWHVNIAISYTLLYISMKDKTKLKTDNTKQPNIYSCFLLLLLKLGKICDPKTEMMPNQKSTLNICVPCVSSVISMSHVR